MKHTTNTPSARGTTIRQDFGRDRSDEMPTNVDQAMNGKLKGDTGNISPMISNGKVPRD